MSMFISTVSCNISLFSNTWSDIGAIWQVREKYVFIRKIICVKELTDRHPCCCGNNNYFPRFIECNSLKFNILIVTLQVEQYPHWHHPTVFIEDLRKQMTLVDVRIADCHVIRHIDNNNINVKAMFDFGKDCLLICLQTIFAKPFFMLANNTVPK